MAAYEVKINEPSIGLTNRTSYVNRMSPQNYAMQRGHRGTASLVFWVAETDTYSPTLGTAIYIYNVGTTTTCVWCGSIDSINTRWSGNKGARLIYLTCVSFEQSFDTIRTTRAYGYDNQYAGDIFADLIQNAAGTLPISVGIVARGVQVDLLFVLPNQTLAQVFASLASDSGLIWGVDPATQTAYMKAVTATPSPFTLASTQILFESFNFTQTRQNYRNRQSIQVAEDAYDYNPEAGYLYTPATAMFAGNGVTTVFTLPTLSRSILYAVDAGLPSTQTGTFTGLPANNDTITFVDKINNLASQVYTFKTTLDNSQPWQVLIGATATATGQNFSDAINATIATAGVGYSLPTPENQYFSASAAVGVVTVQTKFPANCASGTLIESAANFTWAGSATSGSTTVTASEKTVATIPGSDILFDSAVSAGSGPATAVANITHTGTAPSGGTAVFRYGAQAATVTPTAGTTIGIGGYTYTYVATIDNTVPYQLWNHSSTNTTLADELVAAINGTPSASVSSSTPAHPYVTAARSIVSVQAIVTLTANGVSPTPNSLAVSAGTPPSGTVFLWYTDSTFATPTAHLVGGTAGTGAGSPGDTVTVGATTYAFVLALAFSNSTANQILGSASMTDVQFAQRLAGAINGTPDGTTVSSATGRNQSASAALTGVAVVASAYFPGTYGNATGVSASFAVASDTWLATIGGSFTTHLAGGVNSTLTSTSTLTTTSFTLAAGHYLRVVYHRLGGDFIAVENTTLVTARAAIEGTSGRYQTWSSDQRLTTGHALQAVQQGLSTYSTLISAFKFNTDSQLLSAGQVLTISASSPPNIGALINGTWYVQEVRADLAPGWNQFRYTVTVVNGQMLNYVQFWTNLANNING